MSINKPESVGLNHCNDSKDFLEYSNNMDDIYENIDECNPNKKRKILIVFNDKIADMLNNRKIQPIVTVLFIKQKNKYVFCLYHTILFCCTKKC